ncbi:NAD(P)-binding domain-containing protein [Ulvibacter litoralis]|uniref:Nucleoside-diphosphate-sugar epimerase n=1 Tax=Ulvibacter litoralis TaxID=227084 RepID=A0A1G7D2E2_9FLAO|nr:NAD(P)H-binding protein [Ulvibacter litoralis]GHC45340.1 epimerase [Ulvibacter litoralis]SDE45126.1 Nucleoside-diphosphate-sugar epimerase [Ulvibacter litoralis]
MSKTIAIAGLGWLGSPLAQHLQFLGYRVKGSVTTLEKATSFQKKGVDAYAVEISEEGVSGSVQAFLSETDCLIIMIPPGLRRNTGADFVLKMAHFLTEIEKASVPKVILVSSTSVYDDAQGDVNEKILPKPSTQAGKQLLQVEQLFFTSDKFKTSIVRFGGLFGGSRQPARYLAGRENLNDGNAPVNLIHRDDCIAILSEVLKKDAFGHLFNAVTPQHPSKEDYYTKQTKALGLTPPTFAAPIDGEVFKKVDSVTIPEILNYRFKYRLS